MDSALLRYDSFWELSSHLPTSYQQNYYSAPESLDKSKVNTKEMPFKVDITQIRFTCIAVGSLIQSGLRYVFAFEMYFGNKST